ncbi:MAG TPA: PQQ-binding-like beta-propeller repeat protein [Acidimicrobiales bacterium]|nr:PQQ-binding-like beta-propeller repeat protein [Acidimicrobiales bacterium]
MRARPVSFACTALAVACTLPLSAAAPASPGASLVARQPAWTTYGGDPARLGLQPISPPLLPLRARWRSPHLDGAIYGEPLIFAGQVFVATERDVVYSLDASDGRILWQHDLGTPVPAGALPCGDIAPSLGVTSTMVIDARLRRLFVSAATLQGGTVRHVLAAFTLEGHRLFQRDLDRPGWDAAAQLQRAGLSLDDGRVLVGFGGNYGDCGRYRGYLLGVPETGRGPILSFAVPTRREGGIWAPGGVAVDPAGHVYVATGNGSSTTRFDGGDAVFELSSTLRPLSWFAPRDFAVDNASDADLGSTSPVLVGPDRVFIVGKEARAYLLDRQHLGGIGGALDALDVCFAIGSSAVLGRRVYVPCPGGSLSAVTVGARSLALAWRSRVEGAGSPTIAGGVVWTLTGSRLVGLSPRSGRVVASVPTIATERLAAPSAGEGLLVVAGFGRVEAFGPPRA